MPRINSINFYQNRLKIKLFLPKKSFFRVLGYPTPTPYASGGWRSCPQTPIASGGWGIRLQTPQRLPPIADFWLHACMKKNLLHVTAGLHLY